jgi:hypothetical protein
MLLAGPPFQLPGNTLPALYAYVVGAVVLISIVATRGDFKAFMTLSRRMAPPLAIIGLIVSALWLTRAQPPPLGSVDGIYTNSCCAPIQLKSGTLASGTFRVPFKLAMEKAGDVDHPNKIGLVTVTPVTVAVRAGQVTGVPDPVVRTGWFGFGAKTEMILGGDPAHFIFIFSDDYKRFTLCDARCGTEYQFVRR